MLGLEAGDFVNRVLVQQFLEVANEAGRRPANLPHAPEFAGHLDIGIDFVRIE